MSGSFESVRWNACVHRLDLGLYSRLRVFFVCLFVAVFFFFFREMESESMFTPREKFPLPENSHQRSIEPTTLHQAGQRAQHTTN